MEFPDLQRAPDPAVIFRGGKVLVRERVAPRSDEVRAVLRLEEPNQSHLPRHDPGPFIRPRQSYGPRDDTGSLMVREG
jgi:hypothetical protein